MGWAKAGPGRPKGGHNKAGRLVASLTKEAWYAQKGIMPVEVMLDNMRTAWANQDRETAHKYAVDAAPYCHPRLASIDMKTLEQMRLETHTTIEVIDGRSMSPEQRLVMRELLEGTVVQSEEADGD